MKKINKEDNRELRKCSCGFKFADPGEFRNCGAFITEKGESGVICPDCGRRYVFEEEHI
jgi:hypothetical protein